jgi:hypothetical protein
MAKMLWVWGYEEEALPPSFVSDFVLLDHRAPFFGTLRATYLRA